MNMEYTKCPLNYTGNKYKLLPQILPLFPSEIDTFYDLFGGSGVVGINSNSKRIEYNDSNTMVFELIKYLSESNIVDEINKMENDVIRFNLSKKGKESYSKFRDAYNDNKIPRWLYLLSCYSMNGSLRFNQSGNFNMSCGDKDFNDNLKCRLISFNSKAISRNINFNNDTYLNFIDFKDNDFVYLDPPYLPTVTTYNETSRQGGGWNESRELELYKYIDYLTSIGVRWAMSNVSVYRGESNQFINEFMKKYNVHNLSHKYTNNNRYNKDNSLETMEVLITNY